MWPLMFWAKGQQLRECMNDPSKGVFAGFFVWTNKSYTNRLVRKNAADILHKTEWKKEKSSNNVFNYLF